MGYAIAGFSVTGDLPPVFNALVVKTDSIGEIEWSNSINLSDVFQSEARFLDVKVADGGEIVTTGFGLFPNEDPFSIWMKFDNEGNVLEDQRYATSTNKTKWVLLLVRIP